MSSTKQKVGLDGDTVVADYVSKLNYDIKASDNHRSVIKGQQFHSSKFEKVLRLSRKWAQKRNWPVSVKVPHAARVRALREIEVES